MAWKDYSAETRAFKHACAAAYAGEECLFCGYADRLITHRKDGQTHKPFRNMGKAEYEAELMTGEYVRLCFHCHKGVHWTMTHLNLSWDDILKARV